jgi:CheY-like chemotaxis protein
VPVRLVSIGIEGGELLQCVHCHSFLGPADQARSAPMPQFAMPAAAEDPMEFNPDETASGAAILPDMPASMDTPLEAGSGLELETAQPQSGPPLETVITVEDSSLISALLNDMLVEQGLTNRVIPCKNGYEFLARYIRERSGGTPIGLVVMDVKMPVLNGISSAVAMRAHEKAQELPEVPILFFTSKRCDETFRKIMVHTAPAMYFNKGSSSSPTQLQDRIGKVIQQLLREEW